MNEFEQVDTTTLLKSFNFAAPGEAIITLARVGAVLAALGIAVMGGATIYEVVLRFFFNLPTEWVTEISTYILVSSIFLGAAYTHLVDRNVRITILLDRLKPVIARELMIACAWIAILYVGAAAWQSVLLILNDHQFGSRANTLLMTPVWIPKVPVALGLSILAAAILVEIDGLSKHLSRSRRYLPYAVSILSVVVLIALGRKPPMFASTRFDLGSLSILGLVIAGAFCSSWRAGLITTLTICTSIGLFILGRNLSPGFLTTLVLLAIVVFLAIGVRVAFALAIIGMLSVYFLPSVAFPITLADRAWSAVHSYSLTAVPLKVMMATILLRSGLTNELFTVMARLLRRLPGGLAHAATAGCAVFAAISGSSVATAATIGTVACPEMLKRGYSQRLTFGTVAAGGTLGILFPPSIAMIIYGTNVGVPVTDLFLGSLIPAFTMMAMFMAVIVVWSLWYPKAAPPLSDESGQLTMRSIIDTGLVVSLILMVVVALYAGVATATETGAIGVALSLLICVVRGRFSWSLIIESLATAVTVTSFIFLIVVGANLIGFSFDFLKVSQKMMLAATGTNVDRWFVFAMIILMYIVLGAFLDSISMMVLTLPVVFPLIRALDFDPIWFGVVLMIMAEIGLVHPPMGLNLFVLQGIDRTVTLREIAIGALPFLAAMFITVLMLCVFPEMVLFLVKAFR